MSKNLPQKQSPQSVLASAFKADLETITPYMESLLPYKGGVQKFKQMTHLAVMRNPNLLTCNRKSFLLALLWCAYKDLEPGVEDGVWLIPFKGNVVPIPAYKGLIKKAVETESVTDVQPYGIYANDDFEYTLGVDPHLLHQPPKLGMDRGKLIGAYVVITKPDGSKRFHVMDRPSIEKIRNAGAAWKAKSGEGPWHDWEDAMFLKTIVKQGLKYLPVKPAFRDLLSDDGRIDAGESVAALLRESGEDFPEELTLDVADSLPEPEPDPNTSKFDKLMADLGWPPDRKLRLEAYTKAVADAPKNKQLGVTAAKVKVKAAENFEGFLNAFGAWEAQNYQDSPKETERSESPSTGPEGAEPQGQGPGQDPDDGPESTAPSFAERQQKIWHEVVAKGVPLDELTKVGVTTMADITAENIGEVEKLVSDWKPKGRGKKS